MEFSSLWHGLGSPSLDLLLRWGVAVVAGVLGLVAVANAVSMFRDIASDIS